MLSQKRMLSQKFETVVRDLINMRMQTKEYENKNNSIDEPWGMTTSYIHVFGYFRRMNDIFSNSSDSNTYHSYIHNCILDNDIENNGLEHAQMTQEYKKYIINNIKYLDNMHLDTQTIINDCLDVINMEYVIPDEVFNNIGIEQLQIHKISFVFMIDLHFIRMMQKIHFVWKQKPELYFPDITQFNSMMQKYQLNYAPMNYYSMNVGIIYRMFEKPSRDDIKSLIRFTESLIMKYKNIKLVPNNKIQNVSQ